ncbi:class F sortase [Streptomyces sp. NBC_00160]|uniref:class F sortase n=1 Tax=Streptomyces sp. NBC_00160 TaxID=2903628 RepID=UPI002255D602|nr:class F sortase [Streptomyces sp. NBC_00160]MCX5302778.1 class F sortase [Streptomyces sp. NBC_00160]
MRVRAVSVALDAPVVAVGVGAGGRLEIPEDGQAAGWWKDTALTGSAEGVTVIAGHLDTRGGAAVFAPLTRLKPGQPVEVSTSAGTLDYRVRALTVRRGSELPARYLTTTGAHRLVLITCTGPYEEDSGYRDRLYIEATPTSAPRRPEVAAPVR